MEERSGYHSVDDHADPTRLAGYLEGTAISMRSVKDRLLDLLELGPDDRMLDVGCGIGHDVALAAERGIALPVGLDPSATLLRRGRERWPDAALVRGTGLQLPFASASFEACRAERVLQHVDDPDAVLDEIVRVLRPGARIALWEPDWESLFVDAADDQVSAAVAAAAGRRVANGRVGRELERRLVELGFESVGAEPDVGTFRSIDAMQRTFAFDRVVDDVRSRHEVDHRRIDAWLQQLSDRDTSGSFRAGFFRTYAWGTKPAP